MFKDGFFIALVLFIILFAAFVINPFFH